MSGEGPSAAPNGGYRTSRDHAAITVCASPTDGRIRPGPGDTANVAASQRASPSYYGQANIFDSTRDRYDRASERRSNSDPCSAVRS